MKTLLKILLPLLILAAGFGLRAWLIAHAPQEDRSAPAAAVPAVEFVLARLGAQTLWVTAHGELRPERSLALAAEVGGSVRWIAPGLTDGGSFAAGEELLRLDPLDAEQALAAARAEHARAAAAFAIEEANAASARQDWERFGTGEATPLALREPQVALAAAGLAAAQARLEQAETARARCSVRAPFHGRCLKRLVVPGAVVAPGTALALLQSTESFEARVTLSQSELEALGLHSAVEFAEVVASLDPGFADARHWEARLLRIEPELDARDRTVGAIFGLHLAPTERTPLAGLFVRARIRGPELSGVARLPRSARQTDGRVWLVDAEDRLRPAVVTLAAEAEGGLLLRGLADGDRVCITPLTLAVAGMSVLARAAQ